MQKEKLSANCNAWLKRRYIFKKIVCRLCVVYQFKWINTTLEFFYFSQSIHSEYRKRKHSLNLNHRSLNKTFIDGAAGPGQRCRLTSKRIVLEPVPPEPPSMEFNRHARKVPSKLCPEMRVQTIFSTESFAMSIILPSNLLKILIWEVMFKFI